MPKAEISWKRETDEGGRLQVYAQHVGREWLFYRREKRYDQWQAVEEPPLVDWLELLDAVKRLINRRRLRPEEEARVKKRIRERFPETDTDGGSRMGGEGQEEIRRPKEGRNPKAEWQADTS
jgi:hypothetical protein